MLQLMTTLMNNFEPFNPIKPCVCENFRYEDYKGKKREERIAELAVCHFLG